MAKKTIVLVAYPGFSLLELVGAQHIMLSSFVTSGYAVATVSATKDPLETDTPMSFIPHKTYGEIPNPYGMIVLGGGESSLKAMENQELMAYIRKAGSTAELVGAYSTGALLLAAAGFLNGKQATTHWAYAEQLKGMGVDYVRKPYVHDGKFYTSAGVSGSIDMSLQIVADLTSVKNARSAQVYAEYDPAPPFGGIDWQRLPLSAEESRRPAVAPTSAAKQIALVIYPGLTIFDLLGPLGVLSAFSRFHPEYQPVVVAEEIAPITADSGLTVIPNKRFDEVPHPEILVVPGGGQATLRALSHLPIRSYVRTAAESAKLVESVCTGALILGSVGLLVGRPATTHWSFPGVLEQFGARYLRQRWVHDDKYIMSAGVAAGIDATLYMVAQLTDEATARAVQAAIQYDPHPPFGQIDWDNLGLGFRMMRGFTNWQARSIAAKPRRLTDQGL